MSGEDRFRRNVAIVAVVHVIVLVGLYFMTSGSKKPVESISWLDGGSPPAGAAAQEAKAEASEESTTPEPTPEPTPKAEKEKETPKTQNPASPW